MHLIINKLRSSRSHWKSFLCRPQSAVKFYAFSSSSKLIYAEQSPASGNNALLVGTAGIVLLVSVTPQENNNLKSVQCHCQVPCGIFDDGAIIAEMEQHCQTIRKAMVETKFLHATDTTPLSFNQSVRWINTKEEHCNKIIKLVSEYFLCQRVKRVDCGSQEEYCNVLQLHHSVLQAAMKAKQSMEESDCNALELAIQALKGLYI